jgi:hypothetical protein
MFELTAEEAEELRSQNATLKTGRGQHRKYLPYVFTEQGVSMLSSVLNSDRAILVNVEIIRVFVRLRKLLASHKELARKLTELESRVGTSPFEFYGRCCPDHKPKEWDGEHDGHIRSLFEAIRQMMIPPVAPKRKIGFQLT